MDVSSELNALIADVSVSKISVTDLLRRAKILATKLKNKELLDFANEELDGYEGKVRKKIPKYRIVRGAVKALNPYRGWVPVQFTSEVEKTMSSRPVGHPIGQIESLLSDSSPYFSVLFTGDTLKNLQRSIGSETQVDFQIDRAELGNVVESIRNKLLDYLLEIETTGEGSPMSESITLKNQKIDDALRAIGTQLPELRVSMWASLKSDDVGAGRNAANAAKELIDQVLKEGVDGGDKSKTRKERAKIIITKYRGEEISDSDIDVIEKSCDLILAEHKKTTGLAHGRASISIKDARPCVQAAERVLELLFGTE